jgi:membrane protein implicated in regulation of membrane protease activity
VIAVSGVTVTFLVIGGLGVLVLAVSLFVGDVLHFGQPDLDGPFSVPAIAGFVGAFGFAGAIAAELVGSGAAGWLVGSVVGAVAAVPTAWLAMRLARAASRMRTDATPTRSDMLGQLGVVVTPIPVPGYGEIRITLGGQPVKLNAASDKPLPLGTRVFVIEARSDTSVVVEETTPVKD